MILNGSEIQILGIRYRDPFSASTHIFACNICGRPQLICTYMHSVIFRYNRIIINYLIINYLIINYLIINYLIINYLIINYLIINYLIINYLII